ncbi:MAG: thioredoxin family protein, partial [Fimbriimonadaceae bacterium]
MLKLAIFYGLLGAGAPAANLDTYVKAVNGAQSLKATYSVTRIGGNSREFSIELSKPNLIRIDTPTSTIVGDGTSITTFDKAAKTYFKKPQTEKELAEILSEDEVSMFSVFFNDKAFKDVKTSSGGNKTRKGMSLDVVNGEFKSGKKANFFLDSAGLARQLEFVYTDTSRALLDTKEFVVSGDAKSSGEFAFKAPEGSRELTAEEMMSDKWYHDFDEALAVAAKTNRMVLVDFMADWCGPCKMMAAEAFTTPEFKAYSKNFVFCKINSDFSQIDEKFGVTALPTVVFLKADGTKIHQFVGYGGVAGVLKEVETA